MRYCFILIVVLVVLLFLLFYFFLILLFVVFYAIKHLENLLLQSCFINIFYFIYDHI